MAREKAEIGDSYGNCPGCGYVMLEEGKDDLEYDKKGELWHAKCIKK